MANNKEQAAFMAVPRFGGWDQKSGGAMENYTMVFSRARANRKENKSDVKRASFGTEQDFIIPPYSHADQVGHDKV
ncbi:uncharacterized protein A4U43_C07F17150 [Asparagus officinalis]|uniref:RIN4 pathogenic type III effector avirulence factor Avr cleavage site domain-containing protein n=1 Tax=Asparagus officinalis TaxID=4686 RepID=A0A5P1EFL3_ASPOF|nr:uncharacterized protein A4U43_C07F17150 [Asparagus officinalis]